MSFHFFSNSSFIHVHSSLVSHFHLSHNLLSGIPAYCARRHDRIQQVLTTYPGISQIPDTSSLLDLFFHQHLETIYRNHPIAVESNQTYTKLNLLQDLQLHDTEFPESFMLIPGYFSRQLCFDLSNLLCIQLQSCPHSEREMQKYTDDGMGTEKREKDLMDGIRSKLCDYLLQLALLFSTLVEPL